MNARSRIILILRRLILQWEMVPMARRKRFALGRVRANLAGASGGALDLRKQQDCCGDRRERCAEHNWNPYPQCSTHRVTFLRNLHLGEWKG